MGAKRTMSKRRRKRARPRQGGDKAEKNLLLVCAWCKRQIPPDAPVYAIKAKARAGVELLPGGSFLRLHLDTAPGEIITGVVVPDDSDAKREGWDLVFPACSEECGGELLDALQKAPYTGEVLGFSDPASQSGATD
jgi:hypothetical protein